MSADLTIGSIAANATSTNNLKKPQNRGCFARLIAKIEAVINKILGFRSTDFREERNNTEERSYEGVKNRFEKKELTPEEFRTAIAESHKIEKESKDPNTAKKILIVLNEHPEERITKLGISPLFEQLSEKANHSYQRFYRDNAMTGTRTLFNQAKSVIPFFEKLSNQS